MSSGGLVPDRRATTRVALGPWRALAKLIAPNERKSINAKRFPLGAPEQSILLVRRLTETGAWQFRALTSYEYARTFDVIAPESSVDFIRTVETIVRPSTSVLDGTPDADVPPKLRIPKDESVQMHRVGWGLALSASRGGESSLVAIPDQFDGLFSIRDGNFTHAQLAKNVLFNAIEPASDFALQPDLIVRFTHDELGELEAVAHKTTGTRIFDEFKGFLTLGLQSQDGTGGSAVGFDLDHYEREQIMFKGRAPRGRMTVDYMSHMSMVLEGPVKVPRFLGGQRDVSASVRFDLSQVYPVLVDPVAGGSQ